MPRIQFILKERETYFLNEQFSSTGVNKKQLSSGLFNSASFVSDMLAEHLGYETEVVHAADNNEIDRLVTKFKPDICIIEAYWVVPEKFAILVKLHPKVKWVIRNHSALPFLANEGMAMDWSLRYMDYPNVILACNDVRTDKEMRDLVSIHKPLWTKDEVDHRVTLLTNYYPPAFAPRFRPIGDVINIACFGAMRPLKNHLTQAVAAIQFARKHGKHLRFHINGTRIEMKGEPIVRNLQKLFKLLPYELIEHPWLEHDDFCALLREMDISMQVSYTETFNIVTADALVNGVPVITSPDIVWSDPACQADPNSSASMVEALERLVRMIENDTYWQTNLEGLSKFSNETVARWRNFIKNHAK